MKPLKPLLASLLVASVLPLGGCQTTTALSGVSAAVGLTAFADKQVRDSDVVEDWDSVKPQREPKVSDVRYLHEVRFESDSDRLTVPERQRIDAFLAKTPKGRGAAVKIRVPADGARLTERREDSVVSYLRYKEVDYTTALAGLSVGSDDVVRLEVVQTVVVLPECPDWTGRPENNFGNLPSSNFGCANAVNLGLMVAEPRDLAEGRGGGMGDGQYLATSIERYRAGETTPLLNTSTATTYGLDEGDSSSSSSGE